MLTEQDLKIIDAIKTLHQLTNQNWIKNEFMTWQWWLLVIIFLTTWIVAVKLIDRQRMFQVLAMGFFVAIISLLLDVWGALASYWYYPIKVVPFIPRILPFDLGVMPVSYMLLYQRFSKWRYFLATLIVISLIFSFIFEPLGEMIRVYKDIIWKPIFSFPIYIVIGVVSKFLFDALESKSQTQPSN